MKTMPKTQKRTIYTERGEAAELSYAVFESGGQYGLEIKMRKRSGTESARFCDVTPRLETAERIQMQLYENTVTPVTLRDVLEDLFS